MFGLDLPRARPRRSRSRPCIAFAPAVLMVQVLPISFGGLGVREGALVLFLHPLRRQQQRSAHRGRAAVVRMHAPREHARRAGVRRRQPHAAHRHDREGAGVSTEAQPRRRAFRGGRVLTRRPRPLLVGRDPRDPRCSTSCTPRSGTCTAAAATPAARVRPRATRSSRSSTTSASSTSRRSSSGRCTSGRSSSSRTTSTDRSTSSSRSSRASSCTASYSDDYPRFRNTHRDRDRARAGRLHALPARAAAPVPALGFVDTLVKDPTFWSFNSGGMQNVSNQFAAMPSVHIAGRRGARSRSARA